MGLRSFYKSLLKGNYAFGRRMSGMITENKSVGTMIDVGVGALLAYMTIPPMISWATAAVSAVAVAATLPAVIPSAIGTVAVAAFVVGLNTLALPFVAGLFSSAMDKMGIEKPRATIAEVKQAVSQTAQTVSKPFKWVGNKLSHAFKKAHDGQRKAKAPVKNVAAKPKHVQL